MSTVASLTAYAKEAAEQAASFPMLITEQERLELEDRQAEYKLHIAECDKAFLEYEKACGDKYVWWWDPRY